MWIEKKTIKTGDRFTLPGVRKRKDGTFTMHCRAGNETVFMAKEIIPKMKGKK